MNPTTKQITIATSFVAGGLIASAISGTMRENAPWILVSGLIVVPLGACAVQIIKKYFFSAN